VTYERVHSLASEGPCKIQGYGYIVPELPLPLGVSREPPVSSRHVSGVEVEKRDLNACVFDGLLYRVDILVRRPPELDCREARLRRPSEPVQERDLFEQDGNVRAEPHAAPPSATSIPQSSLQRGSPSLQALGPSAFQHFSLSAFSLLKC
jgi:hypothetical protein